MAISSSSEVVEVLKIAARNRSVAATKMNENSSRSHSVFTLYLTGINSVNRTSLTGSLNLCDLAGSERLSRSGAEGVRMKETQAINKSLSALADVFTALGNRSPHVPFRNSKLTYLLQPCLSGDGKTLMIVNVSPTAGSAHETLCSLRFAAQVNQCELGRPKKSAQIVQEEEKDTAGSDRNSLTERPATSSSTTGSVTSRRIAATVRQTSLPVRR
jgi:kinesin family protein C1